MAIVTDQQGAAVIGDLENDRVRLVGVKPLHSTRTDPVRGRVIESNRKLGLLAGAVDPTVSGSDDISLVVLLDQFEEVDVRCLAEIDPAAWDGGCQTAHRLTIEVQIGRFPGSPKVDLDRLLADHKTDWKREDGEFAVSEPDHLERECCYDRRNDSSHHRPLPPPTSDWIGPAPAS